MSSSNPPSPPRPDETKESKPTDSDVFEHPRTISPAEIGEYISFDQCPRYFKHRSEDHGSSWFHSGSDFAEAFRALNLLLSKAGHDFEAAVLENVAKAACEVTDLKRDVDQFSPDHAFLVDAIARACEQPAAPDEPIVISQASVAGTIGVWNVGGDIDLVFIWPSESGATVRIIDVKRTSKEKSYHQIQAATYVALLRHVLARTPSIDPEEVTIEAGIITQDHANIEPTPAAVPSFDVEPRIMDVERLLSADGELVRLSETEFTDVPYQLNWKCANCPYNESCMTDAYEQGHLRLLGLTVAQQETLASHGVETVSDVAGLCRPPNDEDWRPTAYRRGRFGTPTYRKLSTTPGIGELLPTLVYRAQLLEDQLHAMRWPEDDTEEAPPGTGVSDRPRPWIPGSGRCALPDDERDESGPFATEWLNGSMIRIYVNVQVDHLRDRILQLSARVTATASTAEPQRISATSDGAPDVGDGADGVEEDLFARFIDALYSAIRAVNDGIDYTAVSQDDPLIHFYLYDPSELRALQDAFRRHDTERIGSLQDVLEGQAGKHRPMVSLLRPIVSQHLQLPTPAVGLLAAYQSVNPPTDAYRKPRGNDEWSYDPGDGSGPVPLKRVFSHRLFSWTVSGDPAPDGTGSVGPTSSAGVWGIPTRMRHDASIPLGYLWSAVGRIDDKWVESVREEYDLLDYPLDTFRYRDGNKSSHPITPADIEALGRHLCDAMEHVERSLTVNDARLEKEPYPLETLAVDSFESPALADASREYLRIEHSVARNEEYAHYRKQQPQRLLSGNTLPVQIVEIDELSEQTIYVTGRLRYDVEFGNPTLAESVKRACRVKGSDGSSSGSWMVASPWEPGPTEELISAPYDIESGVQSTIKRLDLDADHVEFTMKNFWGADAEFGRSHKMWTTNPAKAESSPRHMLLKVGEYLLLDPQTDDINAARIDTALEYAERNALHDLLEDIRYGRDTSPKTDLFSHDHLNGFADFMAEAIGEASLPSEEQRAFITEHEAQFVGLQGPPGTGKTKGAFAPALMARAWGRSLANEPFAALVTAPSNTAIDELLGSVAELYTDCQAFDPSNALGSIELARIASDKPDGASESVMYIDYNDPDDDPDLERLGGRLLNPPDDDQGKLTDYGDADEASDNSATQTIVFATPSRAWKLIDKLTPGRDPKTVASESTWHLLAVDEASMMTVPQFLLAGASFRTDGQVLVGGDHRQLPPVQKHDWSDEQRRSIRATVPYLSALDYLRVLRGAQHDVLDVENVDAWEHTRDAVDVDIPLVQLSTTYRFGHTTAALAHETVYKQDDISYTAAKSSNPLPARSDAPSSIRRALPADSPITLITYRPAKTYQQSNEIEEAIAAAVIAARPPETSAGVVTPHNAQKSRLQTTIYDSDSIDADPDAVQIETVNRFQGGEAKLMVLSGTVADPQYIRKEADFLLTETRVNVAMTRHERTLVVIAPQSLLGYIPTDPDLYDHATIWKTIAAWAGEAPTIVDSPAWEGELRSFLEDPTLLSSVPEIEHGTMIRVFQIDVVDGDRI